MVIVLMSAESHSTSGHSNKRGQRGFGMYVVRAVHAHASLADWPRIVVVAPWKGIATAKEDGSSASGGDVVVHGSPSVVVVRPSRGIATVEEVGSSAVDDGEKECDSASTFAVPLERGMETAWKPDTIAKVEEVLVRGSPSAMLRLHQINVRRRDTLAALTRETLARWMRGWCTASYCPLCAVFDCQ